MGGVIKRSYDWLVSKPLRAAGLATLASIPFVAYYCMCTEPDASDFFLDLLKVSSPAGIFLCAGVIAEFLRTFAYSDEFYQRTRLSDFRKRRNIKNDVRQIDFESLVNDEYIELQKGSTSKAVIDHIRQQAVIPDSPKGAEKLAELATKRDSAAIHLTSAIEYLKQCKYDSSLIEFSKVLESEEVLPRIYSVDWYLNNLMNKGDVFFHPRDPSTLAHASIQNLLNSRFGDALFYSTFANAAAREFDNNFKLEFSCLDAITHHVLKSRISDAVWEDFIKEMKKMPAFDRIAETRNPVRVLKSSRFLSQTIVLKDKDRREDLLAEAELTNYIKEFLPDKFGIAEPLYITKEPVEEAYTYVMRHVSGETFLDKLKKYDYFALDSIVDCLACIHANVPKDIVRKGELDIEFKLRSKLLDPDFNLPSNLADKILENYAPVLKSFENSTYVYNKDAHPENWLVNSKIVVLDCENNFLVPQQFDLVNLLEYSDYLLDKQKDEAIKKYISSYAGHAKVEGRDLQEFRLAYFNAVVHRAISLCAAWSSPYRISMHSERPKIVANAIHAIDRLKREHNDYYSRFRSYYIHLKHSLEEIKNLVSI